MLYFKHLSKYYPNEKVGLVYDTTHSHCCKVVIEYITEWNDNPNNVCKVYVNFKFVNSCLTSTCQPLDVILNKPLKLLIRQKYNNYMVNVLHTMSLFFFNYVFLDYGVLLSSVSDYINVFFLQKTIFISVI